MSKRLVPLLGRGSRIEWTPRAIRVQRAARLGVLASLAGTLALAATTAPAWATASTSSAASPVPASASRASVIVMASPGAEQAAEQAAAADGGRVVRRLGIISGFLADVPASAVAGLARVPGVASVSPDRSATPMGIEPSLGYDPAHTDSLSAISQIVGAQAGWARGYTGQGVDVAVIDTGVARVPGLDAAGQVIDGPDLSFDSPATAIQGVDEYGHGTHMASIIAGRDGTAVSSASGCTTCLNASGYSDTTKFTGIAPDARIINVKVGAADGATDVSQVIAAIDWVTQHAHDPGMNIRVLNLSFGTNSTQAYTVDPLAQAAEQAWKHGIVVVAAAGNDGKTVQSLADPAYAPFVLAVGADDPAGKLAISDDKVADFAQHGTLARPVDVLAPGTHVIGLRVPGSFVDTLAMNKGVVGTRFQRGSGTSEATAVVSGVAALLAQRFPAATPDAIKGLIKRNATALPKDINDPVKSVYYWGSGVPNVDKALDATPIAATQFYLDATGLGTLDGARGGDYVVSNGIALTGQQDIFGKPFDSASMAALQASGSSWKGGVWNGSRWSGDTWTGSRWSGTTWSGKDWSGSRWSGSRWSGMTWSGSRWSGSGWSGSRWTGSDWSGSRWSSASWN